MYTLTFTYRGIKERKAMRVTKPSHLSIMLDLAYGEHKKDENKATGFFFERIESPLN